MLLVTCRCPSNLVVLDYDNDMVERETWLDPTIEHPWHAVQLSTGDNALCHGSGLYSLRRVCIVDRSGCIVRSFGSTSGQARNELNVPCHLAVDVMIFNMAFVRQFQFGNTQTDSVIT